MLWFGSVLINSNVEIYNGRLMMVIFDFSDL